MQTSCVSSLFHVNSTALLLRMPKASPYQYLGTLWVAGFPGVGWLPRPECGVLWVLWQILFIKQVTDSKLLLLIGKCGWLRPN